MKKIILALAFAFPASALAAGSPYPITSGAYSPQYLASQSTVPAKGVYFSTVTAQIQDKGGQVFNVKAYGAKCDDATDDTTAIKNAVSALNTAKEGTLYFPGVCILKSTITINATSVYVDVSGCNMNGCGIDYQGPDSGTIIDDESLGYSHYHDFSIINNSSNTADMNYIRLNFNGNTGVAFTKINRFVCNASINPRRGGTCVLAYGVESSFNLDEAYAVQTSSGFILNNGGGSSSSVNLHKVRCDNIDWGCFNGYGGTSLTIDQMVVQSNSKTLYAIQTHTYADIHISGLYFEADGNTWPSNGVPAVTINDIDFAPADAFGGGDFENGTFNNAHATAGAIDVQLDFTRGFKVSGLSCYKEQYCLIVSTNSQKTTIQDVWAQAGIGSIQDNGIQSTWINDSTGTAQFPVGITLGSTQTPAGNLDVYSTSTFRGPITAITGSTLTLNDQTLELSTFTIGPTAYTTNIVQSSGILLNGWQIVASTQANHASTTTFTGFLVNKEYEIHLENLHKITNGNFFLRLNNITTNHYYVNADIANSTTSYTRDSGGAGTFSIPITVNTVLDTAELSGVIKIFPNDAATGTANVNITWDLVYGGNLNGSQDRVIGSGSLFNNGGLSSFKIWDDAGTYTGNIDVMQLNSPNP